MALARYSDIDSGKLFSNMFTRLRSDAIACIEIHWWQSVYCNNNINMLAINISCNVSSLEFPMKPYRHKWMDFTISAVTTINVQPF